MRDKPESLIELLQEWGLDTGQPIRAFAGSEEIPWVSDLLQKLGYAIPSNWAVTEFPAQKIPLIAEVTVSPAHFRAVAKIGFHYTLKMAEERVAHTSS